MTKYALPLIAGLAVLAAVGSVSARQAPMARAVYLSACDIDSRADSILWGQLNPGMDPVAACARRR